MGKKKTGPKKPKMPKTQEPSNDYTIIPPSIVVDRSPKPIPPKAYDCMRSEKQLTFYLLEVNGPASSKKAGPFVFRYSPRNVTWKKPITISEYKTQGNTEQPLYFSTAGNKKLQLNEIYFNGHDGSHVLPHDQLNRLQLLQLPAKGTTKLRVFQLLVGNQEGKRFAARSYGKFVISNLDIAEQFRDPNSGLTLRARVNLELTEVASYQLDLGLDLAIPTSIVPTLPLELSGASVAKANTDLGQGQETAGSIKAGSVIAFIGDKGTTAPHLHYQFRYKNEDQDTATKRFVNLDKSTWKSYPKEILDLITLGPWEYKGTKSPAKKLTELSDVKIFNGFLGARRKYGSHRGVDYQLPGFGGRASKGTPIVININCFFLGQASGGKNAGGFEWEGALNGKEFIITIYHINDEGGLAQVSGTVNKKSSSATPQNKGGTTDKAIKKAGGATGD